MAYSTKIHLPADEAPVQTGQYAKCNVCHTQWQIKSPNLDDARGCSFCDAPKEAVSILSEKPTYGGAIVRQ